MSQPQGSPAASAVVHVMQHAEYSPLMSSGLRFIERTQHARSASTSDLPVLLAPPRKPLLSHARSSSVQSRRREQPTEPRAPIVVDYAQRPLPRPQKGHMKTVAVAHPAISVSAPPAAGKRDHYTSYLSMNDSDSDSDMDMDVDADEMKSTFLDFDFSDTASASSHPLPPARRPLPQPPMSLHPAPGMGMESFLSVSPLPHDEPEADSPVHISPTRQFLLPPRFAAGRLARPLRQHGPGGRDALSIQSAPPLQSARSARERAEGAEEALENDWRYMVDNFMDIQED